MALKGKFLELYKQSSFKEAVLAWYPFSDCARVLDLSYGILTDLLRRRCATVDTSTTKNLAYDYLVVLDPKSLDVQTLAFYRSLLTNGGRLLLAYENPGALKFLSRQTKDNESSLPGKNELATQLLAAGFGGIKWYYPLTDHWFTSEVYSDTYLPNQFFNHRLVSYIDDDPSRRFDERTLYKDIVAQRTFELKCGAYLVEARLSTAVPACDIDYAAVTSYRAPSKRFATLLKNDGTVWKIPLHKDAKDTVEHIYNNHQELRRLGVNALDCSIERSCLKMPRLELPTLFDYWAEQVEQDKLDSSKVIAIYDKIRADIHNADQSGKCYWELVPANCFYDEASNELTYFDQEYYSQDVDPDVALTRAVLGLKYSFAYAQDPCIKELFNALLARYQLNERGMLAAYGKLDTYSEVFGDDHRLLKQYSDEAAQHICRASAP